MKPDNGESQPYEKETKEQIIEHKLALITKGAKSLVQMIPKVAKVETELGMIIDEDSDETLNDYKEKLSKKSKLTKQP